MTDIEFIGTSHREARRVSSASLKPSEEYPIPEVCTYEHLHDGEKQKAGEHKQQKCFVDSSHHPFPFPFFLRIASSWRRMTALM